MFIFKTNHNTEKNEKPDTNNLVMKTHLANSRY